MKEKLKVAIAVLLLAGPLSIPVRAQPPAGGNAAGEAQEAVAFLSQSVTQNQQNLHRYQWIETTQIILKGEAKPPKQNICSYDPQGQVQKVPIVDSEPEEQSGRNGRLRQRIVEKKTDEMQQYMQQVKNVIALYVPPNSQGIQQAFKAGNVFVNKTPGTDFTLLILKNYAQSGDQMILSFDTQAMKIQQIRVNTYLTDPSDAVSMTVRFASLPDGTNYSQQTVLDATAKKIQVTTTNSNYQQLAL